MRMERKWTPAQKSAIDTRDCNVLVSAAAGSGKTAVLVERIISMITDPDKNIDIDRLVVVTFTKAAAAQMKDKIRKALDSMLDENPGDTNLLRQITLLNNAQITTIDSFCLWIIRNHFPEVNLDPGFRIMDEGEKKLIENDVLEDVLEEFYAEADEEFFNLVDAFGMGRDDSGLVSIIDKIYRFSRSNPWIDEWFDECMLVYDDETYDNPAIKELYDSIKNALLDYRDKYNRLVDICSEPAGPTAYTGALQSDLLGINEMINSQDFGELGRMIRIFSFEALSRKKDAGADPDIKEYVKGQRKLFKDYIGRLNDKIFLKDDEGIFADMQGAGIQIRTLLKVAKVYAKRVSEVKREKGIIDFNDMEHLALSILVKKEDGKLVYTETADKLANRFEEILIDEYQDSNEVQNSMKASNIYLEAFSKDISYEIAVVGMKAGSSLSNLDELDENQLSGMFLQYIDSENAKQEDGLTETMTGKAIDIINDRPYFRTEVTSVSDEKQTIYTRKYYTVARGYIYMYSLQSKDNEITDEMINDIRYIINSAQYTDVKKSIFENGVFTETLSTILTAAIPIAILAAIYLLITRVGRKSRAKLSSEEAELRARYRQEHNKK